MSNLDPDRVIQEGLRHLADVVAAARGGSATKILPAVALLRRLYQNIEIPIWNYGIDAGKYHPMNTARKVTVEVPEDLLRRAQESTGKGITATIRTGLELVAAAKAYDEIRKRRGKVSLSLDLTELRQDRP